MNGGLPLPVISAVSPNRYGRASRSPGGRFSFMPNKGSATRSNSCGMRRCSPRAARGSCSKRRSRCCACWRDRLPPARLRVGIAWQGNPRARHDRSRSIPLREFAPLAAIPGIRLVSLQQHDGLDQLQALPAGMRVETLGAEFDAGPDAFLDTAAVMGELDLIVTCDTAIAHLAGALGRPVFVLLADHPDWRWLTGRDDSPWYPSMRLFRQTEPGDWSGPVTNVAAALAARQR